MEARKAISTYYQAVSDGDMEKVKEILLKQKVDVNALGSNPLFWAILSPESGIEVPKILIENRAAVNQKLGESLHLAIFHGKKRIVDLLLENGADVNAKDYHGRTSLHLALRYMRSSNHFEIFKILLKNGAYINAPDSSGQTPLHTAVSNRFTSAIKILLEHKADVNAVDKDRKTPLHYVSYDSTRISDSIVIVRLLLQYGADVNAKDNDGHTPLHVVYTEPQRCIPLWGNLLEGMEILMANGADVNAVNKRGETPLHQAISPRAAYHKNDQLKIELLIQYGADVNAYDISGLTPLHKAVEVGAPRIVMALLDAGVDVKNEEVKKAFIRRLIGRPYEVLQLVCEHVISLKVAGLYVNELYIQVLSDQSVHSTMCERLESRLEKRLEKRFEKQFEKKCGQELEKMEDIKLKSNFSLMYILTTNNPRYVRNQALMQQLESIKPRDFPIYGEMLECKLETDKMKSLLLEESKVSLEKLVKEDERTRHLFIPSELLEKIFCHLSCSDLRNLVKCAQVRRRSIEAG